MLRGYKYRIYPTDEQKVLLDKHFGCVRFVYNWGLAKKKELYEKEKKSLSKYDLQKEVRVNLRRDYPWLKEVNSQSLNNAIWNLDRSYKNFFDRVKKREW